ncbi:hypothetical protein RDI58_016022 [Solanum bulbocastanum]|uniref:Gag1-like clamp domain-containing protein n=1 Tax=Solanum bulbocastanum TaxID=147425 RepID=A0AAN8YCI4_SOLBU
MDNYSAAQSQGSISSISTFTQTPDAHGAANTNNLSEFVNHGFIRWNQIRQQWVGRKSPEKQPKQLLEPKLRISIKCWTRKVKIISKYFPKVGPTLRLTTERGKAAEAREDDACPGFAWLECYL